MIQEVGRVTVNEQVAPGIYSMVLHAPQAAAQAAPGQFAHISVAGRTLARPLSLCEIDPAAGTLRLVYQVKGDGTAWLADRRAGEELRLLAPLGRGFTPPAGVKRPVVVGGGIGVPPLVELCKRLPAPTALLGFRGAKQVVLTRELEAAGAHVRIATDDGTAGHPGLVTDLLRDLLTADGCDYIAACGPLPMLAGVAALADAAGVPCQLSLEERMGCGLGACLVCVCRVRRADGEGYARVCADGPVFWSREVVLA